ncbi:MAG TPA: hypothetical protein VJJ48_00265 [Candidatus Paceibacterota bacterium]
MEKLIQIFGVIIPTFFTTDGGVSLSEINRIQAENKQQNDKFWSKITDAVSGVYRKVVTFLGSGESSRTISVSLVTTDEIREYRGVAERNAETASLMHALKLHKRLQEELQHMGLRQHVAEVLPEAPVRPLPAKRGTVCETDRFMEMTNIDEMIGAMNSEVLAKFELAFFVRANGLNSRAAALGKLLSEQGSFFRELVKPLPKGSEQATQTGVIVTQWEKSYPAETVAEFEVLRNELQAEYNDLQKQLNGCRKQIKDAVRAYNLDAERQYQLRYGSYQVEAERYSLEMERIRSAAETLRQQAQQQLAALRVRAE